MLITVRYITFQTLKILTTLDRFLSYVENDDDSELLHLSESEDFEDTIQAFLSDVESADNSDKDDSEGERWIQHTDSIKDICDYDSDTGICEY